MHSRAGTKALRLKEKIPIAFSKRVELPDEFAIPIELQYDYMIHTIAKCYGISITEAGNYREEDYRKMIAFDNLEIEREKFVKQLMNMQNNINQ
jgi:hypothetical protein